MKVLYAAVFESGSTNVSQANAFRRHGVELVEYNYRRRAQELGSDHMRDDELIEVLGRERPDLFLMSKCNKVNNKVVRASIYMGIKVFLWFMDPVSTFRYLPEMAERVSLCDHSFFNIWDCYQEGIKYSNACSFLQEGFDVDVDYPRVMPFERDVAFIGHLRGHRARYQKEVGFEVISNAYEDRHAEVVSSTRINLNFTEGGASDRVYKVMAAGGFLLTEPWPLMENDFRVGVDLDVFTSPCELKEKVRYYLENEKARSMIAENGKHAVQRFSRDEWAAEIARHV